MTRNLTKSLMALGLGCAGSMAHAVGWEICIDPTNTQPYSIPYIANTVFNELFMTTLGGLGTVTYGGQNSACFGNSQTFNVRGRIGFGIGPTGSVQSPDDDNLYLTFGMPVSPAGSWSYATILEGPTPNAPQTLFGANNFVTTFAGASGRYVYGETQNGNVHVKCRIDVVGDAARVDWQLTNTDTTNAHPIGLWFGQWVAMIGNPGVAGFPGLGPEDYIILPGRKPIEVDQKIDRSVVQSAFPEYMQFCFGQTTAYGLQVDLGPEPSTIDVTTGNSDATPVDSISLGSAFFLLGAPPGNDVAPFPDVIFGDVNQPDSAYIQKYNPGGPVQANATREIISYYKSTWSNSNYTKPYAVVADAPHVVAQDDSTPTGLANDGNFTFRVWIDNVRGFSDVDTEIPINDVKITLTLPDGMTFQNGDQSLKIINSVAARQMGFVDYSVQADGIEVGDLPYTIKVQPVPGPVKILHGTIRVAATPKIKVEPEANLVTVPWNFADNSWQAILALNNPNDFTVYDWDPQLNSYVPSSGARRGFASWLILNPNTHPSEEVLQYTGAMAPTDTQTGANNIQLHSGWNLIGNPYQYAFPLGQLVGVSASNPTQSYRWRDLVAQGVVSPYLAYWDPTVSSYRYIQGDAAIVQPNKGYWIKVLTGSDLTLNYPAIYDTFIPGGRAVGSEPTFAQSANHWRLRLSATGEGGSDTDNFVGVIMDSREASVSQTFEPPQAPTQNVSMAIDGKVNGRQELLAQSISNKAGNQEFNLRVQVKKAGNVTITWPEIVDVPKSVTLKLVDTLSGKTINMRSTTGYMFPANANTTRMLKVQAQPSTTAAGISNVTVTNVNRATRSPMVIRYTLGMDSTVGVRILAGNGSEVARVVQSFAANQGDNEAVWTLVNSRNQPVAPGTYVVEITAVSLDGKTSKATKSVVVTR